MSNFTGVGIFWIGLNRAGLGCWRLTLISLRHPESLTAVLTLLAPRGGGSKTTHAKVFPL